MAPRQPWLLPSQLQAPRPTASAPRTAAAGAAPAQSCRQLVPWAWMGRGTQRWSRRRSWWMRLWRTTGHMAGRPRWSALHQQQPALPWPCLHRRCRCCRTRCRRPPRWCVQPHWGSWCGCRPATPAWPQMQQRMLVVVGRCVGAWQCAGGPACSRGCLAAQAPRLATNADNYPPRPGNAHRASGPDCTGAGAARAHRRESRLPGGPGLGAAGDAQRPGGTAGAQRPCGACSGARARRPCGRGAGAAAGGRGAPGVPAAPTTFAHTQLGRTGGQ